MNNKILSYNYIDEEYNDSSNFLYFSDDVEILHLENIVYTICSHSEKISSTVGVSYAVMLDGKDTIRTWDMFPIHALTHKIPKYVIARHKLSGHDISTLSKYEYRIPKMEVHILEPLQASCVSFRFQLVLKTKGKFILNIIDLEGIPKESLLDCIKVYVNETPIEIELG